MMDGSQVFLVVFTVMLPSTRFSSQPNPYVFNVRVTNGHTSRKYFSRYLGNKVAKELSSNGASKGSAAVTGAIAQWSMSGVSHGLSLR
jgi:hypothetical protein